MWQQISDLQEQLRQVPVLGLDIVGDAIGDDVAVVGRLRSNGYG